MRSLDKQNLGLHEDWYGNTAAVPCFACGKVFLVSQVLHRRGRACPQCGVTRAAVSKSRCVVTENCDPPGLDLVKGAAKEI